MYAFVILKIEDWKMELVTLMCLDCCKNGDVKRYNSAILEYGPRHYQYDLYQSLHFFAKCLNCLLNLSHSLLLAKDLADQLGLHSVLFASYFLAEVKAALPMDLFAILQDYLYTQ